MAVSIARGQSCPGIICGHPSRAEPLVFQGGTKPFGRSAILLHISDEHLRLAWLGAAPFGRIRIKNPTPISTAVPLGKARITISASSWAVETSVIGFGSLPFKARFSHPARSETCLGWEEAPIGRAANFPESGRPPFPTCRRLGPGLALTVAPGALRVPASSPGLHCTSRAAFTSGTNH